MRNKWVLNFASFCVAATSGLIFYNAAIQGTANIFDFTEDSGKKVAFLLLSLLGVATNEFFEFKDHADPSHTACHSHGSGHSHEGTNHSLAHASNQRDTPSTGDTSIQVQDAQLKPTPAETDKLLPTPPTSEQTRRRTLLMIVLFAPAIYGLYTQSTSVIKAAGGKLVSQYLGGFFLALAPWARFIYVPIQHCVSLLWGNAEETTQRVIQAEETVKPISGQARFALFLLFCGTHLPEALLLSDEIPGGNSVALLILKILSISGIAIARSAAHLNHMTALPLAYSDWKGRKTPAKYTTLATGILSGAVHTTSLILSALRFWSGLSTFVNCLLIVAALIEFFTGWVEHQQHGGRVIAKMECLKPTNTMGATI